MKKMLILGLALAAGAAIAELSLSSGPRKAKGMLIDGVAAYVNGDFITISDVMTEVRRSPYASGGQLNEANLRKLYNITLNALIDRKLILEQAKKSKMSLQSWAVDNRIREIVANNFNGDESKLNQILSDRGISYEEWRKRIEEDLTVSAMRYQFIERRVQPTPAEVRAEYESNREKYQTERAVAVSMIILDPPPAGSTNRTVAARAAEISAELKKGKSFAELAKIYSSDSKAANGGSWGKINPDDVFRKEIRDALAALKPGQVSDVLILDDYGYIIRKDDQQDSRVLTYQEALPYAEGNLRMKMGEKLYKEWTARMRKAAYIKIVELPGSKK